MQPSTNQLLIRPALRLGLASLFVVLSTSTLSAAEEIDAAITPNRILVLDGDGAHVELPVAAFETLEQATLEAWVRWDAWGYFSQWFAYGSDVPWNSVGLNHFDRSTKLQFFQYAGDEHRPHVVDVTAPNDLGRWLHLAAVSGPEGMHLYLDGLLVGQTSYAGSFADLARGTHAYLGRSSWVDNDPFHGALDEVRLWSVARTGEQIALDMDRRLTGTEPGLQALWNFDDGTLRDATGNGFDGVQRQNADTAEQAYPANSSSGRPAVVRTVVRDASGGVIKGAGVRLHSASGEVLEYTTGDVGTMSLAVPDTGLFKVEVLSHVTEIAPRSIRLHAGQLLDLDLRPEPPSLLARWSGEGDATDDIGPFHGRLRGSVTFGPGVVGQAFQFDGSDTSVVVVPWAPGLLPDGSFTIVAWIRPTSDRAMRIMGIWGDGGDWDYERAYLVHMLPGMRLSFFVSDDARQRSASFHSLNSRPNVLAVDRWNLITAVWDADLGERRLYANGVMVARRTEPGVVITRSIADLGIGSHITDPEQEFVWSPFHGRIDEVSLFDMALTEDRIEGLYSIHAQARWPADGVAIDETGSGHDGALVGEVTYAPGVSGQAFAFDGRISYVELDPRIGNYGQRDFSAEMWLWLDEAPPARRPLLGKNGDVGKALGLFVDPQRQINAVLASPYTEVRVYGRTQLALGQWHHIALVREGPQLRLFVDGQRDGITEAAGIVQLGSRNSLLLGGGALPDSSITGRLDDIVLHNRALRAEEIQATYRENLDERNRRIWTDRLQTGGTVTAAILVVLAGVRGVRQRRSRQRERQRLAESERARRMADEANEAKGALMANMSHEIRTPMNAIMGHAQMLQDDPRLDDEQRASIATICEHGGLLLGMVDDILDLSKSEAGHMELHLIDFDLGRLVDSLQTLFAMRCRQKDLQWEVVREGELGMVRGDEAKLRQVLVNLLGNAVKFTDEGSVVLHVSKSEDEYSFEVRDTGPGIVPEQQTAMFEPFQQGAAGLARGGTGLGLAIVQRHVTLMGGRLQLVSGPNEGTQFTISMQLPSIVTTLRASVSDEIEPATAVDLPVDLAGRLLNAAQMHNITEVKRCLEQMAGLGEHEARLAAILGESVRRFDLAPVLRAMAVRDD